MSRPHSHHSDHHSTSYNERLHSSTHTTRSSHDRTLTTYDQFLIKKSAKSSKAKHHWGIFKKDISHEAPPHEQRLITKHAITKSGGWDKTIYCKALYDFHGVMPCDLQFKKGQRIAIVTRTETQNDWWEGTVNGKTGIFPANYVSL